MAGEGGGGLGRYQGGRGCANQPRGRGLAEESKIATQTRACRACLLLLWIVARIFVGRYRVGGRISFASYTGSVLTPSIVRVWLWREKREVDGGFGWSVVCGCSAGWFLEVDLTRIRLTLDAFPTRCSSLAPVETPYERPGSVGNHYP